MSDVIRCRECGTTRGIDQGIDPEFAICQRCEVDPIPPASPVPRSNSGLTSEEELRGDWVSDAGSHVRYLRGVYDTGPR